MGRFEDYLYRKASMNKIPLNGTFELSPVCNLSCKMCYVRKTDQELKREGKKLIPWERWLELAKACKEAGMLYLLLTGGEPFVYPGFKQLYEGLQTMGFRISINTNGTMIDEKMVVWLKKYPPARMNITLYGASAETYQKVCGHSWGYEKTVKAIDMLRDAGITVVINASMIPENEKDMEKIIAFGDERNLMTRVSTYMFPPARREAEETDSRFQPEQAAEIFLRRINCQVKPEDCQAFYQDVLKKAQEEESTRAEGLESIGAEKLEDTGAGDEGTWGDDNAEQMKCRAGRSSFWVSWEGNMTACGMFPYPVVMHPFEEPFQESWLTLTNTVRGAEVLRSCHGCKKREVCNPCAAMIYTETGDVNQKADYLCTLADCIIENIKDNYSENSAKGNNPAGSAERKGIRDEEV